QLTMLKKHFAIVPLGALLKNDGIAGRSARPRCVITFDDGWRDNYDLAFPILRRHGLPATIFLTTDFIGTDHAFWHTQLIYLFTPTVVTRALRDERTLRAYPSPVRHELRRLARGGPLCTHVLDPLIEIVKAQCDEDVIDELVQALSRRVGLWSPLLQDRRF